MITPGSRAMTGPIRHGSELSSLATHGTARYMRLWSAVMRMLASGAEYAIRLYCVTTTGRTPPAIVRSARSTRPFSSRGRLVHQKAVLVPTCAVTGRVEDDVLHAKTAT